MLKNYLLNEIRNNYSALEKIMNWHKRQSSMKTKYWRDWKKRNERTVIPGYRRPAGTEESRLSVQTEKGLSNQEIAEKMQISIPTVKTHYSQAIKLLREHFEKLLILLLSSFFS